VYDLVRKAATIHVTTPDGTDLTAEFDPGLKWIPSNGLYHQPGRWGNLPEGETFTCPANVNGRLVVHLLGDHFCDRYGILAHPVVIEIRDGYVKSVACEEQAIADDLTAYLDSTEYGRRIGEFAIGTNIGLTGLAGNLLQDEKFPGVHVAFGDPYPGETGANWSSKVHVDVIPLHCTVSADDRVLMRDGQFDYTPLNVNPARQA
jgi:aminopeptidase